jgi:hypothetical protein
MNRASSLHVQKLIQQRPRLKSRLELMLIQPSCIKNMRKMIMAVILIVAGASILLLAGHHLTVARAVSHAIGHTHTELKDLEVQIRLKAAEDQIPGLDPDQEKTTIEATSLCVWLRNSSSNAFASNTLPIEWVESNAIVDRWKNKVHVVLSRVHSDGTDSGATNYYSVNIWSNGPNGKDELGRGDDIAVEPFQIEVPNMNSTRQP